MILLDPGHPNQSLDEDSRGYGAKYENEDVTLVEHELALRVCLIAKRLGEKMGDVVRVTREEKTPVRLSERVDRESELEPDCFVSVHLNWFSDPSARGSTIFHYPGSEEGERLGECMDRYFEDYTRIPHRRMAVSDNERDDDQSPYLFVLANTECPAILTELAFLSNPKDRSVILEDRKRFAIEYAEVILGAIRHWELIRPKKK